MTIRKLVIITTVSIAACTVTSRAFAQAAPPHQHSTAPASAAPTPTTPPARDHSVSAPADQGTAAPDSHQHGDASTEAAGMTCCCAGMMKDHQTAGGTMPGGMPGGRGMMMPMDHSAGDQSTAAGDKPETPAKAGCCAKH